MVVYGGQGKGKREGEKGRGKGRARNEAWHVGENTGGKETVIKNVGGPGGNQAHNRMQKKSYTYTTTRCAILQMGMAVPTKVYCSSAKLDCPMANPTRSPVPLT